MKSASLGQRRAVLSEEEYTSTLSDIMERDYFPDLANLRQKAAVLERRAVGDFKGAVAVRKAARRLQQHQESLAQQEKEDEQTQRREKPRPLHREDLTGFHARVTSEDNHDFHTNMKQEVRANQQRLQQVFLIEDGREREKNQGMPSLLASDQFNAPHHRIEANKNTSEENAFFFVPSHCGASGNNNNSSNGANLLTNGKESEKALMPPPAPKKKDTLTSPTSTAILPRHALVEYIPKRNLEKRIEPSQTRFPTTITTRPNHEIMDYDGASSTTDYSTDATTDLDAPPSPVDVDRKAWYKRQKKEQETLVAMTPLIEPGRAGEPASPLITWGTVSDTPIALENTGHAASSFSMPAESQRDKAARLAEAKLAHRAKVVKPQKKRNRSEASLTPAAKSLFARVSNTPKRSSSVRAGSAFSSALRSSYTPQRSSRIYSRNRDQASRATPRTTAPNNEKYARSGGDKPPSAGNITDGLLNLPN